MVPLGLIPAAGAARRLGAQGTSKEVLPFAWSEEEGALRPATGIDRLVEAFRLASIEEVWVGLRSGKWDVPSHLVSGQRCRGKGMDLSLPRFVWRVLEPTSSVPMTVARTLAGRSSSRVLLGFPDILFRPHDAARELVLAESAADVLLAAVPGDRPEKSDMFDVDNEGRVHRYVIKDRAGRSRRWTWVLALWNGRFGAFLDHWVAESTPVDREPYLGDVLVAAQDAGLDVRAKTFPGGASVDLGTPADFLRARQFLAGEGA